jgi:flagellar motor switch protein FliG
MDDRGLNDAAILLMSLGEEEAAEVFKHLTPKEVQKLGETIARMRGVTREKVDFVIDRFTTMRAQSLLVDDASDYVRSVLKRALGDDKAPLLIDRILQGGDVSGIESLKWMDPLSVAELLRNEHPQIVAAILVHLEHEQAAVLMQLPERLRSEVMLRVATLEGIQPTALKDLNEVLFKVLAGGDKIRKTSLGGVKTAAEIINQLGGNADVAVLDTIRNYDADLAQKIMDKMFVFDDLVKLDDRSAAGAARGAVRDADRGAQGRLDGGARQDSGQYVHACFGSAARGPGGRGPMRLSEVEAQQKEILKVVRRLAEEARSPSAAVPKTACLRTGHDQFHHHSHVSSPAKRSTTSRAPLAFGDVQIAPGAALQPCTSWPR